MKPANLGDALLARRGLPAEEIRATDARWRQRIGDLRVLVRVGARGWPEMAGKTLVYLLDGEDDAAGEIPVYLPESDEWITVKKETTDAGLALTKRATMDQTARGKADIEMVLNVRVRVVKNRL